MILNHCPDHWPAKRAECDRKHFASPICIWLHFMRWQAEAGDVFSYACVMCTHKTNKLERQIITHISYAEAEFMCNCIEMCMQCCWPMATATPTTVSDTCTQIISIFPKMQTATWSANAQAIVQWSTAWCTHDDANNFQFWIRFNLNGDKISYTAQYRTGFSNRCRMMHRRSAATGAADVTSAFE